MQFQQVKTPFMQYPLLPFQFYQPHMFPFSSNYFVVPFTENVYATHNTPLSFSSENSFPASGQAQQEENQQYRSKVTENTVLYKNEVKLEERRSIVPPDGEYVEKSKRRVPHIQKDNRNVASNLLRIFFKNILEVNVYDSIIESIIQKNKIGRTLMDFLKWLEKFKINYKNYIKPAEIKKIMSAKHSDDYQKIFVILLDHYRQEMGLLHCLTSKRIQRTCTKRHLEGLRVLLDLARMGKE